MKLIQMLKCFLTVILFIFLVKDVKSLCHSSCSTCATDNDPTQCTLCQSSYLAYQATSDTEFQCLPDPLWPENKNIEKLQYINSNTQLGLQYLKSITLNETTILVSNNLLWNGFCDSNSQCHFQTLTVSAVQFSFDGLGQDHYGVYFRLNAYHQCGASAPLLITVDSTQTNSENIASNTPAIIQTPIVTHTGVSVTLKIQYSVVGCTTGYIQDISVYLLKCDQQCIGCVNAANQCYDCKLGYKHDPVAPTCTLYALCHSTCLTCSQPLNQNKCLTCPTISSITYYSLSSTPGQCLINNDNSNNNWQQVININKNTLIGGQSLLKKVIINSTSIFTSMGTLLSSILYHQNVIDFNSLSSNILTFYFTNLGIDHHQILIRVNLFTQCNGNKNVKFSIDTLAQQTYIISSTLKQEIFQSKLANHVKSTLTLKIQYGDLNEQCAKVLQDLTIYLKKCQDYCTSCPDGGKILQFGSSICLADCPIGFYISSDGTQCMKCNSPCMDCQGTPNNCTLCGVINNTKYYLNDTNLNDVNTGGVCVPDCTGAFYQGIDNNTCLPCHEGCDACQMSPTNCSKCKTTQSSVYYFLQPDIKACLTTCPQKYFKFSDHTCKKCASGFGDWDQVNLQVSCSQSCHGNCLSCFGSAQTECFTCSSSYYLQPLSTTCLGTCPAGYSPSATGNICQATRYCHSSCSACNFKGNKNSCTSCSFALLPSLTFENIISQGSCSPVIDDTNNPNIRFFTSIDKNSIIGQGNLQSIIFNGASRSVVGTKLSDLLFTTGDMLNFDTLTSNEVNFNLNNLGFNHHKVFVRFNAYASCSSLNQTLILTVGGKVKNLGSVTSQQVYESDFIAHISNSLTIQLSFGTVNQGCPKLIQDISVYIQQCASYCLTCPDGGSYLQYGSTQCLSSCPEGFYLNENSTQCLKCSSQCLDCQGGPTNCTKCGVINGKIYFLNDTDLNQILTGGVCVQDCTGSYFQNLADYSCKKCGTGCKECQGSANNCSSCWLEGTVEYFLQPGQLKCQSTCPSEYFKFSDNTCKKCTNSKYGNWNFLYGLSLVEACSIDCPSECFQCFGALTHECTSCASGYFLQQGTTTCSGTCPAGYMTNSIKNTCQPTRFCHSSCKVGACSNLGDISSCTACQSLLLTDLTYESFLVRGPCTPDTTNPALSNIQLFTTISKTSIIGASNLKSLTVPSLQKYSTLNTSISTLIYNDLQLINFDLFTTSTTISFQLANLGFNHHHVYVRINAYSSCLDSDGNDLEIIIDGKSASVNDITPTNKIVQTPFILHTGNSLTLTIKFGLPNKSCSKLVQDISIYLQKCQSYCATCPDGGKLLQYGLTSCLSSCPVGYYPSQTMKSCDKCDINCTTCTSTSIECTSCGFISGRYYFLQSSTKKCVSQCPPGQFQNYVSFTCDPCADGCVSCDINATNCFSCTQKQGKVYYKQPGQNKCVQDSCPAKYSKTIDFTCIKCTNGKFGDGVGGSTEQCTTLCEDGCETCFDAGLTNCLTCTARSTDPQQHYYLQPDQYSTQCSLTCPSGYYGNQSTHRCDKCSSLCKTCQMSLTQCTSCNYVNGVMLLLSTTGNKCISACYIGEYADLVNKKCLTCADGCAQCYGPGLDKCTKCTTDTNGDSLYKHPLYDQCLTQCPIGQYEYALTNQCLYCHRSCLQCQSNATDCIKCANETGIIYFLYSPNGQNTCVVNCPLGYYTSKSTNQCVKCDQRCVQCYGPGNGSCTKCKPDSNSIDHFLVYGTTICSDLCQDGTYYNYSSFKCQQCGINCITCVDLPTKCMSCGWTNYGVRLFLDNYKCVQFCTPGYYQQTNNNTCNQCQSGCKTCNMSGLNNCQSCKDVVTTVIDPDTQVGSTVVTKYYKHIGIDTCDTSCPTGQFIDSAVSFFCQPCSPECKACQNTAKTCLNASSCNAGYFFFSSNNSCLAVCPDGFYANTSTITCTPCHPGCALCKGGSLTQCTACKIDDVTDPSTPVTYFKKISLSQCSTVCDAGQYEDPTDFLCKYCHNTCSECLDASENCTSCKNVSGIVYFLYNPNDENQCVQVCPDGFYGQKSTNKCMPCDERCKLCTGPSNDSCSECQSAMVNSVSVSHYLVYNTKVCSDTCPDGQYADATTNKCLLCDTNCKTCETSSTNCLSCNLTQYGKKVFLQNTICVQTCKPGFYGEIDTNICTSCHPGCLTCTQSALTDCQSCTNITINSVTTIYYKHLNSNTCSLTCPDGQFIDINKPNICQLCSPQCLYCVDNGKRCTNSSSCSVGFYFYSVNNSCLGTCPNGFYGDQISKICVKCGIGCAICTGPGLTSCTVCQIDTLSSTAYYKYKDFTICNTTCPEGFYPKLLTLTCQPCHSSCALCTTGPEDCQSCKNSTGIIYFNYGNKCVQKCPDSFYGDPPTNLCKDCHQGCALCATANNNSCSACRNVTATNLVYFLQYGTTYCSLSCPNGQYKIPSLNICGKCNDNCNTCDGTATNCTSCYLTPTGIKLFLSGNICVQQCPSGQYANQISHLCEDCHQGCATCFGPILQQCYTCKKSNDGLINYYKYINQTICGQQLCPLGQYININFTSQCQTCDPSCKACIDKATNCLSTQNCSDNYFFYAQKNSCLLACPGGYYAQLYTNKNYGACNLCQPGCALCTGPGLMMCQKCTTYNGVKYYKEILTQECTINCIAGQYEVDTDLTCKTCHPSCVICNSSATDCQQCRSVSGQGYFYFSNQCLIKCPDGYWGNIVTNQCELCHDACQTCFGTTIQQCYSCRPILQQNYYLIVGTTECALECPYGQYEVNSTKTCRQCSTNCASCDILSTNCTSCSYLATTQILFWYNYKCVIVCPVGYWQNTTIENDHQCTLCHPYCSKCTGPSAQQCQSCKNVSLTDPLTRVTSVTNYYKDLESNTCSSTCPDGQFISSFIPNSCVYCSTACQLCSITKTNCTKCTSSFYLYQQAFSCLAQCPAGYFNDNTLTAMNYKCTKCTPGCSLCTGSGLDNCQSCTNVTTNNNNLLNIVSYFKHPTLPKCIPSCPVGYYGQLTTNKCQKCQQGCVACQGNASYCSSCTTYQKTAYYFNLNSCVSICPNGTYGDPITFTCLPCIYFSYEGNCLLTCPNSTFVNVTNNKTICQNCSVELNTCDKQYAFGISTKLVNEGKSMQHKVTLPQGLYSSITPQQLQDGLRVFLVIDQQSRRRLQQQSHRRLLQQLTLQLSVENLKISPDRNYIFIQTSTTAESIDFTKAKVQANFKGGVLISRDGTGYMSTTTEFTLNDPGFMESYYKVFLLKNQYLAEGIVLTGIGFILMLITLGILSRRAYHQVMAFMMFIQCIGFLRLHSYPLDVNIYTILSGFTYLQFMFVPNGIVKLYPIGYEQVSLPAIKFAIGDHNFFTNMGGALQIFLGLQLILFIYFIWNKDNQQRVTRYKFWQQALITFFFIKTIFSSFLALYSFALNPLNSMPIQFLVSQVIAIAFLLAYLIYLLVFVRRHRAVEFYKVHNLLRMGCLLLVIVNRLAGMITLNILQVIVFGIDFWLYRNQKVNKWLYVIDRLLCLVAFNCAAFMETPLSLLIALGVSLYVVLSTKIYMVIKAIMRYRQQKQEQQKQLSNLSLSDAVINIQEQSQSRKSYIQKLSNIQQSPDKKIQDKQALARTRKKRSKQMLNNNSSQSIIKLNTQQQNNKTNYYNNSINNNKESMNNIINRNDSSNIIFHFDQDDNVSNNDDKQQQQNRQNYVSNDLMNKSKSHNKKEQQQQRSLQQQWNQQNNSIAYLNSTNRQLKDSYTKRKTKKDYHFAGEQQYSINKQQQQQQKQQQQSQQIKDDDNISDVQEIFHSKNNNNLNNTNNNNLNYTNTNRIKLPHDQLVIYLDPEQYDKEIMLDNSNNNTNYNSINTNSIDTSGFKTDIAFYPIKNNNNNNNGNKNNNNNNNNNYEKRRQKNRTKLQVNNKSTNLIDDVEVIQIEHHSDNDNNYENQSSISELSSNHGNSVERWMFKKDDNQRQTVNKNIKNNKNDDKKQQKETQLIWKVLENQDNNLSKEHNNGDNYNKADEDLNIVEY